MQVVVSIRWKDVTPQQYEKLKASADMQGLTAGLIAQIVGFVKNTLSVTDVWESEDRFAGFAEQILRTKSQELGIEQEAEVEIFPLHSVSFP